MSKMIMTKSEIRKELSKIRTLKKAQRICTLNNDAKEQITLEMIDRMSTMLRIVLKERKVVLDDKFQEVIDELESYVDEDDNLLVYGAEIGKINANIGYGATLLKVDVLEA